MSRYVVSKPIPGYENLYKIDSIGRVYSKITKKYLKHNIGKDGYHRIHLVKNKTRKGFLIHRLVAETFLDKVSGRDFVDHMDRNKSNNSLGNLRWVTCSENNLNNLGSRTYLRGVYYHKRLKKWEVALMLHGERRLYVGVYSSKEDAYFVFYLVYVSIYGVEPFSLCEF